MIPVISIRPRLGGELTVAEGRKRGLVMHGFPLSQPAAVDWRGPDAEEIDGLLVGSARAFTHGGSGLAHYRGKPVYAVGPTTAKLAAEAGFAVEQAGSGGLQEVLDRIARRPLTLLRLAGTRQVTLEPPTGITIITCEVYTMEDLPMPAPLVDLLRAEAIVLIHSAGAAEHFRSQCLAHGIDLSRIRLAALGPRIAAAAGEGWGEVRYPATPADGALLALAADMCH